MRTRHLFISHSWNYPNEYARLVRLLRNRPYFRFRNYSVARNNPIRNARTSAQLREAIRNRMKCSSVVLIPARVSANRSKWINVEIHLAKKSFSPPKPVIAVEPWGSKRTSGRVKGAADRIVGWNTESIVAAIRELT